MMMPFICSYRNKNEFKTHQKCLMWYLCLTFDTFVSNLILLFPIKYFCFLILYFWIFFWYFVKMFSYWATLFIPFFKKIIPWTSCFHIPRHQACWCEAWRPRSCRRCKFSGVSVPWRKQASIEVEMMGGENAVVLQAMEAVQTSLRCELGGRSNVQGKHGAGRV